jgi:hypothetical protein
VADFLAMSMTPPFDGIIYPSAQHGPGPLFVKRIGARRSNVVLFHSAARIPPLDDRAEVEVTDNSWVPFPEYPDDGPEVKYSVFLKRMESPPEPEGGGDDDEPTLRFTSLAVHYVKSVRIETVSSSIGRYTRDRDPSPSD